LLDVKSEATKMRKIALSTLATALVIAVTSLTGPAQATDTGQALGQCIARGPDCTTSNNKDGSLQICVNNTGGRQCVNCPGVDKSGNCSVAAQPGKSKGSVETILNKSKAGAARQ
jgi:hypothetical protein